MTNYGPSSAFVLIGGRNVSTDMFMLDETTEQILERVDGLSESWQRSKPIGLAKVMLEANGGFYDSDTATLVASLQGLGATRQLFSYGVGGYAVGADAMIMDGVFAAVFKRIAQREGLTKANALYTCSGVRYNGSVIHGIYAEVASGDTEAAPFYRLNATNIVPVTITSSSVANPTVITAASHGLITGDIIYIASHSGSTPAISGQYVVTVTGANTFTIPVNVTVGGTGGTFKKLTMTNGVVDLHVPALTLGGYTSVTIKARHSTDGVTFADLATFTTVTALGTSQRVTITGQINPYIAISWLWVGSGSSQSVTPYVAISNT